MKKIALIVCISVIAFCANAQDYYPSPATKTSPAPVSNAVRDTVPKFYLGLAVGLNNYTGIFGVGAEIRTVDPLLVRVGAGIGSWGTKLTVGLVYELHHTSGWAFGISYSSCSGLSNFKTNLQVDSAGNATTKNVTLDLNTTGVLNFTATYNWVFHRRNKFFIELGYSVPLQQNPYSVTDGSILTSQSEQVMSLLAPHGVIIGIGVLFGL
jgi:hypothetical protein